MTSLSAVRTLTKSQRISYIPLGLSVCYLGDSWYIKVVAYYVCYLGDSWYIKVVAYYVCYLGDSWYIKVVAYYILPWIFRSTVDMATNTLSPSNIIASQIRSTSWKGSWRRGKRREEKGNSVICMEQSRHTHAFACTHTHTHARTHTHTHTHTHTTHRVQVALYEPGSAVIRSLNVLCPLI